jgi:hypothetical protein
MIVTGCNGKPGLIHILNGKPHLIETGDTRGACFVGTTLFYLTRDGLNRQRMGETASLHHRMKCDWHGLHRAPDCLLAVDPVTDLIHEFTLDGEYVRPWKWKEDSHGRLHNNDVCVDEGDIYQCTFNWGICKNGVPMGTGKSVQPHSVTRFRDLTYYCASNLGTVIQEGDPFCEPGGFTRGLLATDAGLWVGSSQQRHNAGGTGARVELWSWTGKRLTTIELPTNEVYSITTPEIGT